MASEFNPQYVIHSNEEPLRLERQARIYGFEDNLRYLRARTTDRVLDAGCGSGSMTRAIARAAYAGSAVGVDRDEKYVDFARRTARAEGLANASFEVGDVTALPFASGSFDLVWSKHLLQWVAGREKALAEFVRVTRRGGRVVCSNFDRFCLAHYPEDARLQADLEKWFGAAREAFGFDGDLGRKLPSLMQAAGLVDIRVDTIPDRAFSGFGGDPEKAWNWELQLRSAHPFTGKVFGSEAAADDFVTRTIARFTDPGVYLHCTLFYVEGTVP